MQKLNPAWVAHNDLYNEGAEGYNPHPKFVAGSVMPAAAKTAVIVGKRRTHADAVRFCKACLSGAQKDRFMAEVRAAFPENY